MDRLNTHQAGRVDLVVVVILGAIAAGLIIHEIPSANSDTLSAIVGGFLGYLTRKAQEGKP